MQDLQQTLNLIVDYIKGIWIKKRYVMICSWLICPIGFVYVATLPDVYESSARVYVDTRSVLRPLLRGLAIQTDAQQEIQMMAKTLLSRSNIETIARETDMDLSVTTDTEFDSLVRGLTNAIQLRGTGRDNIYTISYSNRNPAMAQNVVQETLDLFVEGALGNNRRGTDTAERFINQQIAEYEERLSEAEQRLADFQRQYNDVLPVQGSFYSRLESVNLDLAATQLEIRQTQEQVNALRNQIEAAQSSGALGINDPESGMVFRTRYDDRILALEESLDQLRLRFTERHPDVIEAKNLLSSLEEARNREVEAFIQGGGSTERAVPGSLNQELKLEISRLEGQIASLKVREEDLKTKRADLETKIDLVPQIEAESTALNRDYGITKQKYEDLLRRRESADLSRRADVSAEEFQFRIIEPPSLPALPSGPNRLLLYTSVLVIGFGAGIGIAFLISQLSPVLIRAKQLSSLSNYPVWGSITHLQLNTIRRQNKIRLLVFLVSSGAILSLYGVLIAAEILNVDLLRGIL